MPREYVVRMPDRELVDWLYQRSVVDQQASVRAKQLLEKYLTPSQLVEYTKTGRFSVVKGKKKYIIGDDLQVRVYHADDYILAPALETWCVLLPHTPMADTILHQLLLLRSDPAKLREAACVSPGRRYGRTPYTRVRELMRRAGYADT